MKKNQNQRNYDFIKTEKQNLFQRIMKRFYDINESFSFVIFDYSKANQEKLQIVYANIRV